MFVSPDAGEWKVQWEGSERAMANTATQEEAVALAKDRVSRLPEGTCSQIVVQGHDGKFITEWTYGQDPFPPAG